MKPRLQKTYTPKPSEIERDWLVVDAAGVPLGRLASEVAQLLRGKHKPIWAPHLDVGDHVIVVNAAEVAVTGKKEEAKIYYRHSGYPGGLSEMSLGDLRERYPERIIETAVKGILPKNKLGRAMITKLRVYPGPDPPHGAQDPTAHALARKVDTDA